MTFHYCKDGPNQYFKPSSIKKYIVHPNYKTKSKIYDGFDIAIATLTETFENAPLSLNALFSSIDHEKIKEGDAICMIGYPAEYKGYVY